MLDPKTVSDLASISETIRQSLVKFRSLKKYLEGRASFSERQHALLAELDVNWILRSLSTTLDVSGYSELKKFIRNYDAQASTEDQKRIILDISSVIDGIYYADELDEIERARKDE